jgi:hypothetical protein
MDTSTVIVSLAGAIVAVVGIVALLVKSFVLDKPKTNGNGKEYLKLTDVQEALTIAVQGFRESHLENKMRQEDMIKTMGRIESNISTCADILKALPKRTSD